MLFILSLILSANAFVCGQALRRNARVVTTIAHLHTHREIRAAYRKLDRVYRAGWRLRGIPDREGETVFAHSKKVAKAALVFASGGDRARMALMAYVHDLAESDVPDYTPHDKITPEEKHAQERAVIERIAAKSGRAGRWLLSLWEEYEANETYEAKLVHQLDKLDAAIQSIVYARRGYDTSEFLTYTRGKLTDPRLIEIFEEVIATTGEPYAVYYARLAGTKKFPLARSAL